MKVAILGTGNIGCDLLVKVMKSKYLECIIMAGQRSTSDGLAWAKKQGVPISDKSIDAVIGSEAQIVFDCTNYESHIKHLPFLKDRFVINLTPYKKNKVCVPSVNLEECLTRNAVDLGSCSIQAVIPKLHRLKDLEYIECVTTIASNSAGMGTRENLSEYLITTAETITQFTGAKAKVILVINPTITKMHNTLYLKRKGSDKIQTIQFSVEGCGDYLPKYAGNLDIITVNAIKIGEAFANGRT